jgi:hypothetical protein
MAKLFRSRSSNIYFGVFLLVLASWFSESRFKLNATKTAAAQADIPEVAIAILEKQDDAISSGNSLSINEECNIESLNGESFNKGPITVSVKKPLALVGWSSDKSGQAPLSKLLIRLKSKSGMTLHFRTRYNVERKDVAAALKLQVTNANFGFHTLVKHDDLPSNDYHVSLVMIGTNGNFHCDQGRVISIR